MSGSPWWWSRTVVSSARTPFERKGGRDSERSAMFLRVAVSWNENQKSEWVYEGCSVCEHATVKVLCCYLQRWWIYKHSCQSHPSPLYPSLHWSLYPSLHWSLFLYRPPSTGLSIPPSTGLSIPLSSSLSVSLTPFLSISFCMALWGYRRARLMRPLLSPCILWHMSSCGSLPPKQGVKGHDTRSWAVIAQGDAGRQPVLENPATCCFKNDTAKNVLKMSPIKHSQTEEEADWPHRPQGFLGNVVQ